MTPLRALLVAGFALTPMAAGAEAYPGVIIPANLQGIEFKIEITAADKAGPFDLRIWRLDGASMKGHSGAVRSLAKLACESEGYRFDGYAERAFSASGEVIIKAGCKA